MAACIQYSLPFSLSIKSRLKQKKYTIWFHNLIFVLSINHRQFLLVLGRIHKIFYVFLQHCTINTEQNWLKTIDCNVSNILMFRYRTETKNILKKKNKFFIKKTKSVTNNWIDGVIWERKQRKHPTRRQAIGQNMMKYCISWTEFIENYAISIRQ